MWLVCLPIYLLKESIDLAVSYILEGNKSLKLSKTDLTEHF